MGPNNDNANIHVVSIVWWPLGGCYVHESMFIKHAHGFGELNISLWLVQLATHMQLLTLLKPVQMDFFFFFFFFFLTNQNQFEQNLKTSNCVCWAENSPMSGR